MEHKDQKKDRSSDQEVVFCKDCFSCVEPCGRSKTNTNNKIQTYSLNE